MQYLFYIFAKEPDIKSVKNDIPSLLQSVSVCSEIATNGVSSYYSFRNLFRSRKRNPAKFHLLTFTRSCLGNGQRRRKPIESEFSSLLPTLRAPHLWLFWFTRVSSGAAVPAGVGGGVTRVTLLGEALTR